MWRYSYGPVAGGHPWFALAGFLFWVLVIGGIVVLLVHHHGLHDHYSHHQTTKTNEPTDPLEIAKARYARGEINLEEFTQIKKQLQ